MGGASSPISPGGILNGVVTNVIAGGNPITGAMLNAAALAGSSGGGGSFIGGGFEPSIGGVGQGIWEGIKGVNTFANQNPITTQLGLKAAQSMLEQPQIHYAQPGQISRGKVQPVDYMSLLNPQNQTVMRPQPISLL